MIFDNTNNLGIVELNGYIYGSPITIEEGNEQYFQVYNADSSGGSITFTLSFSGAVLVGMVGLVASWL